MLYHLTSKDEWESGKDSGGYYVPKRFAVDGFIHTSFREQVLATANRKFIGRNDLIIVFVDEAKVGAEIVVEDLGNRGEAHPHIYGKLPLVAVLGSAPLVPNAVGQFDMIPEVV